MGGNQLCKRTFNLRVNKLWLFDILHSFIQLELGMSLERKKKIQVNLCLHH